MQARDRKRRASHSTFLRAQSPGVVITVQEQKEGEESNTPFHGTWCQTYAKLPYICKQAQFSH